MEGEDDIRAKIKALQGRLQTHTKPDRPPQAPWQPQPGTPYGVRGGRGFARGGRATFARPPVHRHRSLVLNPSTPTQPNSDNIPEASARPTAESTPNHPCTWVSKRGRHAQLINTAVYNERSQQRTQEMAQTVKQRQQLRSQREKEMLSFFFGTLVARPANGAPATNQTHEIVIDNVKFRLVDGGNKLLRTADNPAQLPTPKSTIVAGVTFNRTKHGNLVRNAALKPRPAVKKSSKPCPRFSQTGSCPNGNRCRYVHDSDKIAICKDFLRTGSCKDGEYCNLSHDPTPHRVPACIYYLRGNCNEDDKCRYAHVRVSPAADVCRPFAILGYCDKGASCPERHVCECPDYANTGLCRNKKCRLPHVDRAGQIRKAAALRSEGTDSSDLTPDLSSDEEEFHVIDSDDVDSENEVEMQEDFVHF